MLDILKAVIARLIFGGHGFLVIWQAVDTTGEPRYWYLALTLVLLCLETLFTLALKKSKEWRWFCPSVFIYLGSVVPAIWLLELDKLYKRSFAFYNTTTQSGTFSLKSSLDALNLGLTVEVSEGVWITLLEQFLMLALILGRWLLPLGTLTREQLSHLLLVHIGTAADIIEFFDSFKDDRIADKEVLVFMVLAIWSWSLLQFTLTVTSSQKRQKGRSELVPDDEWCRSLGGEGNADGVCVCCGCCTFTGISSATSSSFCMNCCCNLAVWGVFLEIILQDAPFLVFRLLLILHYRIVSYMNIFFTAKNTLVISLQFYRLVVVQTESKAHLVRSTKESKKKTPMQRKASRKAMERMNKDTQDISTSDSNKRGLSLIDLREMDKSFLSFDKGHNVCRERGNLLGEENLELYPDFYYYYEAARPCLERRQKSRCYHQGQQISLSEDEPTWIDFLGASFSASLSPDDDGDDDDDEGDVRKISRQGMQMHNENLPALHHSQRLSELNHSRNPGHQGQNQQMIDRLHHRGRDRIKAQSTVGKIETEAKVTGQDTGYSTVSTKGSPTSYYTKILKKPKLMRQEPLPPHPKLQPMLQSSSSNHRSFESDQSDPTGLRSHLSRRSRARSQKEEKSRY